MLTATATANTIVNSPPLPIGWSGLLLFPCAYIALRGSFTGSAGQRQRQDGISGSRRACLHRSVVHCQRRPVQIGGRLSLETRKPITPVVSSRRQSGSVICASALNARCGGGTALQTKPVTREAPIATITKKRNPQKHKLDDGGEPPCDNGNNGGDGNNGKGSPNNGGSGGLLLFGFLLFMSYLKDLENEGSYREKRTRDHADERN